MATKIVTLSDVDGAEIPEGTGARVTIKFHADNKVRVLDVTTEQAENLGGREQKARGRKAKA